jgi:hypothetical protein
VGLQGFGWAGADFAASDLGWLHGSFTRHGAREPHGWPLSGAAFGVMKRESEGLEDIVSGNLT